MKGPLDTSRGFTRLAGIFHRGFTGHDAETTHWAGLLGAVKVAVISGAERAVVTLPHGHTIAHESLLARQARFVVGVVLGGSNAGENETAVGDIVVVSEEGARDP